MSVVACYHILLYPCTFSPDPVLVMSTLRFLLLFMHQPYTMTTTIAKRRMSPNGSPTVKYGLSVNIKINFMYWTAAVTLLFNDRERLSLNSLYTKNMTIVYST